MLRSLLNIHRLLIRVSTPRRVPLSFERPFLQTKPSAYLARSYSCSNTYKQEGEADKVTETKNLKGNVGEVLDDWLRNSAPIRATSGLLTTDLEKSLGLIEVSILRRRATTDRRDGIILGVKLNRPERGNALTSEMLVDLRMIFDVIASYTHIVNGVFLLPSSGNNFCSGADTFEMSKLEGPREAEVFIRKISALCDSIRSIPVPVVALIHGPCLGAGLELVASCDIRVCTSNATFSMPEVLVHLPSVVQARLLCDIVGWGRARHLMLTGAFWDVKEAFLSGLVTKKFTQTTGMMAWAHNYMAQLNDPSVRNQYRAQKRLINGWEDQSVDDGIEAGVSCFARHFAQKEMGKSIAVAHTILKGKRQNAQTTQIQTQSQTETKRTGSYSLSLEDTKDTNEPSDTPSTGKKKLKPGEYSRAAALKKHLKLKQAQSSGNGKDDPSPSSVVP